MKYSEFYEQANDQLIESLSNMWFRGHPDALDHFKHMVGEREPLLSEPVFQTIFPWRNSECDFLQHATRLGILEESFDFHLTDTHTRIRQRVGQGCLTKMTAKQSSSLPAPDQVRLNVS